MKILALDTSTDACSAALWHDGHLISEYVVEPRAHTRLLLPMVDKVLAEAGIGLQAIDALAFGRGPGAFTGVRIATGATQGLALAADCPVIPVSTLAAMALQAHEHHQASHVLVALDARMQEVYWGEYCWDNGIMSLQGEEQVIPPDHACACLALSDHTVAAGSGWCEYADVMRPRFPLHDASVHSGILPSAAYIAQLAVPLWQRGAVLDAEQAQPVYLRNKVALTTRERAAQQASS